MEYETNFYVATHWLRNNLINCWNIGAIDNSVYDNMRFENNYEIAQFYITDCSEYDVDYLEKHFGLKFTYSDLLDKYVLCVCHGGTSWDYVHVTTDIEMA